MVYSILNNATHKYWCWGVVGRGGGGGNRGKDQKDNCWRGKRKKGRKPYQMGIHTMICLNVDLQAKTKNNNKKEEEEKPKLSHPDPTHDSLTN